jgi:hypothetical protein
MKPTDTVKIKRIKPESWEYDEMTKGEVLFSIFLIVLGVASLVVLGLIIGGKIGKVQ